MSGITFRSRPSAESHCGVAADWDYFCQTCRDDDRDEPAVVQYQGFEFASVLAHDTTGGVIRRFMQAMPCNYFTPLNPTGLRVVPWHDLLLSLDTPATLADFDWDTHTTSRLRNVRSVRSACFLCRPRWTNIWERSEGQSRRVPAHQSAVRAFDGQVRASVTASSGADADPVCGAPVEEVRLGRQRG